MNPTQKRHAAALTEVIDAMTKFHNTQVTEDRQGTPILYPREFADYAQQHATLRDVLGYITTADRSKYETQPQPTTPTKS